MTKGLHLTRRVACFSLVPAALLPSKTWAAWPLITVHKDPTCGCCGRWIAHLELNGFQTKTIETSEINRVRARLGVPF